MGRFLALREIKDKAGLIQPGCFIPGVEEWPHYIIRSNVNCGNVYDLKREFKLDGDSLAKRQREQGLLTEALARVGAMLVDDPDNKGCQMLAPNGKKKKG